MTETEIKRWMGISDIRKPLSKQITQAMAALPVPVTEAEHSEALITFMRCAGKPGDVWEPAADPVPPVRIRFVTWDPETDGVAVRHNGELVWQEDSFDSLAQYLRGWAPLGVPVILEVEET